MFSVRRLTVLRSNAPRLSYQRPPEYAYPARNAPQSSRVEPLGKFGAFTYWFRRLFRRRDKALRSATQFSAHERMKARKYDFQLLRESESGDTESSAEPLVAESKKKVPLMERLLQGLGHRSVAMFATIALCIFLFAIFQSWANRFSARKAVKKADEEAANPNPLQKRTFAEFYEKQQDSLRNRKDGPAP